MKAITTALFLSLVFLSNCALIQPDASQVDRYLLRVRYEQEGCFGRCPIYALNIYDNGLVVFEGERFTDKEGTWQKLLSRAAFSELMADFEQAQFEDYPAAFPTTVADLSTLKLSYTRKNPTKTYITSWKIDAPKKLESLASKLRTIAESPGYKMYSESIQPRQDIFGNIDQKATEELIIQLEHGVDPSAWVIKYKSLNLQYKSKVTPNGNYYLFNADPNKMDIESMLDLVRRDENVLGAQTNKQVSPRG